MPVQRSEDQANVEPVTLRPPRNGDDVEALLRQAFHDTTVAGHGVLYDVLTLPGLVAVRGDEVVGHASWTNVGDAYELVSVIADPPGHGIGRLLVHAVADEARRAGATRLWCTMTNDNLSALGFYQHLGFRLVALRPDGVAEARLLKPTIPLVGAHGLPLRDELDLELTLG
jgi:GNAT superfamily N-acetyltransferase